MVENILEYRIEIGQDSLWSSIGCNRKRARTIRKGEGGRKPWELLPFISLGDMGLSLYTIVIMSF
jgi:hypothetical protein